MVKFCRLQLLQRVTEVANGSEAEKTASQLQQNNFWSDQWSWPIYGVPPMESCLDLNCVDCDGHKGVRRSKVAKQRRKDPKTLPNVDFWLKLMGRAILWDKYKHALLVVRP